MSTWREAMAELAANVWAPIGSGTTYHRLAIDTPAIAMSFCGLVVSTKERAIGGFGEVAHPGVQCAMCRLRSMYPGQLEASS